MTMTVGIYPATMRRWGSEMHSTSPPIFDRGTAPRVPPEEQARADLYAVIASLLLQSPSDTFLAALASADALHSQHEDNALDRAWERLIVAASMVEPDAVRNEFDQLFISVGTPAVNPYASYHLTGFMMEKPLAALREELAMLGLARADSAIETEDHIGALCEVMRLFITGAAGLAPRSVREQRDFFERHIAPWQERCLNEMRNAEGANFYQLVADFVQAFFEIERQAFAIEEADETAPEMLS